MQVFQSVQPDDGKPLTLSDQPGLIIYTIFSQTGQHFGKKGSMGNRSKRWRPDLADEKPELQPEERQSKRKRTETGENDVKTGKTEACMEVSCSDPRRV